jgi:hypothetical protein
VEIDLMAPAFHRFGSRLPRTWDASWLAKEEQIPLFALRVVVLRIVECNLSLIGWTSHKTGVLARTPV